MPKNQNVTPFPSSPRTRRKLLRQSRDGRLRLVSLLRSAVGWILTVCVIAFLAFHFRLFLPANMNRILNYAKTGLRASAGDLTTISYNAGAASDAALFSSGLVVADSDAMYVTHAGGVNQLTLQLSYTDPVIEAKDNYILAYDRGGTGITLSNSLSAIYQKTLSSSILSASLSDSGKVTVVTDESGYRSAVTIYGTDESELLKYATSDYYISSATLSPSNRFMAALAFQSDGITLQSKLLLFNVNSDKVAATVDLGDAVGLSVQYLSNDIIAVLCDTGAFLVSRQSGEATRLMTYTSDALVGFAYDDHAALIVTRSYTNTARAELHVLQQDGTLSDSIPIAEEPQSLSFAAGRMGVLSATGLTVYDAADGVTLWKNDSVTGASRVLMMDDGTACVLFSKEARLITESTEEISNDKSTDAEQSTRASGAQ